MSRKEVGEWIDREASFWSEIRAPTEFQFNNYRNPIPSLANVYSRFWADIRIQLNKSEFESRFTDALSAADSLDLILSEGHIGASLAPQSPGAERMLARGELKSALLFSSHLWDSLNVNADFREYLLDELIFWKMHPNMDASINLLELQSVLTDARKRERLSRDHMDELAAELDSRREEISRLEHTYSEKLKLEAPATYWSDIVAESQKSANFWLRVFIGTVVVIVIAAGVILNYGSAGFSQFLKEAGLGGVAFISLIALSVGWVLKHFSRGYVQNMQAAADARHRKVLVMTYLGLAKDAATEITDSERALILNALFRPAPPSTSDDGPPAGILELIRKS
ncbi:DUF6161 domain-containing protein [Oricola indica]|uniref:DUF6161 domain-containing protein n=1 Tax=Oricola indica TaxID=2872591 RepID=UPI003CCBC9BF